MTKKLKLDPDTSYVLGIYSYNKGEALGLVTKSRSVVERFIKIMTEKFKVEPEKILVEEEIDEYKVHFYHSKIKKAFEKTLERKEHVFKYKNAYSASYFAGIFDTKGAKDHKGYFIRDFDPSDDLLLDRLGFRTAKSHGRTYVSEAFMDFIKGNRAK